MGSIVITAPPLHYQASSNRTIPTAPSSSSASHERAPIPMSDAVLQGTTAATSGTRPTPHARHSAQHPPKSPHPEPQSTPQNPTQDASAGSGHVRPQATASNDSSARASPQLVRSPADSTSSSPPRIRVQSLSHIQSFALDGTSPFSQSRSSSRRSCRDPSDIGPQYEISAMPVADIIEMVAGLLTKITTTNDRQHEHLHRHIPPPDGTNNLDPQTSSVLAFHGKNIPNISILSYLSRIHKYCPTTYEVFLSLLVYFDRMTERVNAGPMQSLRQANQQSVERATPGPRDSSRMDSVSSSLPASQRSPMESRRQVQAAAPPSSGSLGRAADSPRQDHPPSSPERPLDADPYSLSHFFVVDSFNIHRLVIAGVTCASKFFSDVFYTNSRYAKVGGLPLAELNQLELQFLLLNDFRLAVPLEEMEAYGTMLVEFYAREVVAQQNATQAHR
ncbi:hypothetical protein W97_04276 [Coniosporium apollinis CBS 100218]|uniref:Cyclin-domain-containing protein n=1 Tax=Coniosporium apollinis (strain CBS 100218) TaxID=1168221 RepID=R7YTP2_CONA1|nr:uncharacterized protein W97_04276 [Coniosporium apollinis CBS 100218]EON65041.1 hypothetical protein W97_04276 [Coniosporium apollinis CBS 100218]